MSFSDLFEATGIYLQIWVEVIVKVYLQICTLFCGYSLFTVIYTFRFWCLGFFLRVYWNEVCFLCYASTTGESLSCAYWWVGVGYSVVHVREC